MKRSWIALVVAVVAVATVVSAIAINAQQRSASCSQSDTTLVTMFGKISLPEGSLGSNLSITVTNTTCVPVVGITVTSVQPQLAGVVNTAFVAYDGVVVNATNPLPAREIATGSIPVSGVVSGQQYTLTVSVLFAPGYAAQTETLELYPESS